MINRLKIAIPIIAVITVALFWLPCLAHTIFFLVILRTLWEFYRLLYKHEQRTFMVCYLLFSALYLLVVINSEANVSTSMMIAGFFGVFIIQSFDRKNEDGISKMGLTFFGFFYITYLGSYIIQLYHLKGSSENYGALMVFYSITIVKWSDATAYFGGRLFGKHKLIPRISPNKSWEGLACGMVGAVVPVVFFLARLPEFSFFKALVFCLLLGLTSILGDLGESMIKRELNVKDAADDIPGFGGTLDMADSLLTSLPVAYWFIVLTGSHAL